MIPFISKAFHIHLLLWFWSCFRPQDKEGHHPLPLLVDKRNNDRKNCSRFRSLYSFTDPDLKYIIQPPSQNATRSQLIHGQNPIPTHDVE